REKPTARALSNKPLALGAAVPPGAAGSGAWQPPFAAAALKVGLRRWSARALKAPGAQRGYSPPSSGAVTHQSRLCWSERQVFGVVGRLLQPRRPARA